MVLTRADTCDEDTRGVGPVLLKRPIHHAHDPLAVSSSIVDQSGTGRYVPALVGEIGAVRINDNETILRSQVGKLGSGERRGCIAVAPVRVDKNRGVRRNLVGHVDVESHVAGVSLERHIELLKRRGMRQRECSGQGSQHRRQTRHVGVSQLWGFFPGSWPLVNSVTVCPELAFNRCFLEYQSTPNLIMA